jgi:hypothetical protein
MVTVLDSDVAAIRTVHMLVVLVNDVGPDSSPPSERAENRLLRNTLSVPVLPFGSSAVLRFVEEMRIRVFIPLVFPRSTLSRLWQYSTGSVLERHPNR